MSMSNIRKALIQSSLACLIGLTGAASADQVTLRFAHEAPESAIKGQTANRFAELVSEYSEGSIRVDVFPGGQLVPTEEEIRATARGQVDFIAPFTSYFSSLDSNWDIFYQPLLFATPEEAMSVFGGAVGEELLAGLDGRGLVGLAIWHDGPVYLFTKSGAVTTVDGLQGKRVRVFPSDPLESILRDLGASPVSMPATEVYSALQQGVVNGVLTTPTFAAPAQWHEVLTGMTKTMMGVGGYGVAVSARNWNRLNSQQQAIILRAMEDATSWNHQVALENIDRSIAQLADHGMEIVDPSDEMLTVWQGHADAIHARQGADMRALIEMVRSETLND